MRPPLAHECPGLRQRLDRLLQEEWIPFGALDQESLESLQLGVMAEERIEERMGAVRRQRVEAELTVGRLVAPGVLVLGAIVDQQAEPRGREGLDEAVEERLRLGIDPLEVLEHEKQGLDLGFTEHEPPDRLEGALPPLRRIEGLPRLVVHGHVEQGEERGKARLQRRIEREEPPRHLFANHERIVAILDPEVRLEEFDDGPVRGRLAVGDRSARAGRASPGRDGPA